MASSGNFCTFNEAYRGTTSLYDHVLSAGNTRMTQSNISGSNHACGSPGTHLFQSGKFYWEAYIPANQTGGSHLGCGILNVGDGATKSSSSVGLGISTGDIGINPANNVVKFSNVQTKDYTESAFSSGDILQVAVDADNGAIYFGKNNTFLGSSDPTSGSSKTGAGATWTPSSYAGGWAPSQGCQGGNGNAIYMNWGQDSTFAGARSAGGNADENGFGDFVYSPPSGYLALCSANLPISDDIDPAQTDDDFPQKNFNVVTYTGNSSTNAITGLGFKPDLFWFQRRDYTGNFNQGILDSSRGVSVGMYPDRNDADTNFTSDFNSFDNDGFTLKSGSSANINNSGSAFVAWCWRANGGTTSTNSDGSTDSTVQANTAGGFSIITYTGNGSNRTIGHGLSKAPEFMIVKDRSNTANWIVYHKDQGAANRSQLNTSVAFGSSSTSFQSTDPTNSVISLGTSSGTNASSANFVCYAWHSVDGYCKVGTTTGNGSSSQGSFTYLGFRPRLIIYKRSTDSNYFYLLDTARNTINGEALKLLAPVGVSESDHGTGNKMDFYSNGFKMFTSGGGLNGSGGNYVYIAWGDVPYKYNNTR